MVRKEMYHLDTPPETVAQLSLRRTYVPKVPVEFAGPSYFGGKDDQLMEKVGPFPPEKPIGGIFANVFIHLSYIAGDIHIWDRESGALLHHVREQVVGGDLTCLAWNTTADRFMFATGSHDGAVRIWTSPNHSSQPSPYPEFTFQSEGGGGEGGSNAHELRASLDELGAQLSLSTNRQ
jgi:hypothetical protein